MEGILEADGYEVVSDPEQADVILVNTCAIRDHAERRVIGRVGQLKALKRTNPNLVLGVTGCMAQRMGGELLERAPHVDLVMGPDAYRSLATRIRALREGGAENPTAGVGTGTGSAGDVPTRRAKVRVPLTVLDLDSTENYEGLESRRTSGPSAWVPIQRGCDHRCTFCIVPYVRGPEKNRRFGEVIREVGDLVDRGVTEVTLLGQTVNSYRDDGGDFSDLLRAVARVDGVRRVRFTSPHPNDVSPELVEVMATEPAVCEQLHLPAQSGSDRTLKRMVRRYTVADYVAIVDMVRAGVPDVALSTDIIVGFPGETHEEFEQTLELMRSVRFDEAYTYRYSLREGTPATRLPAGDFLPESVAQARLEELIDVARGIQAEINETEIGRVEEVLVDGPGRDPGFLRGRTRRGKVVVFRDETAREGDYRSVELEETTGATFVGTSVQLAMGLSVW